MPFFTKGSYNGTGADFSGTFVDFEVFEDCEVTERGRPEPGLPELGLPEPGLPEPGLPEPGFPVLGRPKLNAVLDVVLGLSGVTGFLLGCP